MKVIFLDIDGVLNNDKTYRNIYYEYKIIGRKRLDIDRFRLRLLKKIVEQTNAVIVLSSSWRLKGRRQNGFLPLTKKGIELVKLFKKYGLSIYDITPYIDGKRDVEIFYWLETTKDNIESFVILDDESFGFLPYFKEQFIRTSILNNGEYTSTGLCSSHVKEAIKKLK